MNGNSIIPTPKEHDNHYARRCIVCEAAINRSEGPAGEVQFCGQWGDACADCYPDFAPEAEAESGPEAEKAMAAVARKRQTGAALVTLAGLHNSLLMKS